MATQRLLLLDGHSLAYRAFYALPVENFSTTTGQPTNAVFGFTSMLINVLRDEQPSHVAVAFDVSRQTFRTESFPEYKANRASSPEGFKGQVDALNANLKAVGEAKKGDLIHFEFTPEAGTRVLVNGQPRGTAIPGDDFFAAVLRIWIGDKPVDGALKKALVGG